ncbi:MAG: glycosyltransferase [Sphingobium sp.]
MAMILLFLAMACAILFLHPYIFYPLSLRWFRERPVRVDPHRPLPEATLMFSAYNEERALPAKIANLREIKARFPRIEILAYSDCSSDDTLSHLLAEPDLLRVVPSVERTGKATGMRKMAAEAKGEILICTDANVLLDPASIEPLLRRFSDADVGGVAGALHYVNEDASTTARVGGLYWRLEEALKQRESRVGSIMGADGSIFAIRKALYPQVPPHLLDDMTASMSVTFQGQRLIHADDVAAYEKNATSGADEFRRKRRIACRSFNTHRYLWPQIWRHYGAADIYKYVSHKLLRWLGLVPLVAGALSGTAGLVLAGYPALAAAGGALAALALALGRMGAPLFGGVYQITLSIVATFLGVIDSLAGKTYQTWTPAQSRD